VNCTTWAAQSLLTIIDKRRRAHCSPLPRTGNGDEPETGTQLVLEQNQTGKGLGKEPETGTQLVLEQNQTGKGLGKGTSLNLNAG